MKKPKANVMSTAAVSMIINGVKYKAGQKPVRVCPAPASRPSGQERYMADSAEFVADRIQQLEAQRAPLRQGRAKGAKGKDTQRLEKQFDKLYRDNPDCSSEEIRLYKASPTIRNMSRSTVATHWRNARERSQK